MKMILILSVLIPTAAALNCFVGTLLVGSYNKLPTRNCGDIDYCINNEDGGLFMAGCDELIISTYGQPEQYPLSCPKNAAMNTCNSVDIVGADNVTSKATICCCDDDWCNKSAFGIHSLALPLLLVTALNWIM